MGRHRENPMLRAGGLPEVYLGEAEEPPQLLYRRGVRLRRRHRLRGAAAALEEVGGSWRGRPGESGLVEGF